MKLFTGYYQLIFSVSIIFILIVIIIVFFKFSDGDGPNLFRVKKVDVVPHFLKLSFGLG